ncbi:MAG: ParB/RepB/Spo0J family partition protein [Gammaproteobacteria bacterium]
MAKKKSFQIGNALSDGLEETMTAAHSYSGELRVDVIPIKRIETDPANPRSLMIDMNDVKSGVLKSDPNYERKIAEIESLQSIATSIREQGIINPVVVYKQGERYRLIAGERRTLASLLAGKTDIQAKILDEKPTALKVSILQWIENIERSDLTLWERLRNLEKISLAYAEKRSMLPEDITVTELSNLIGCSKPHAMNYKALLEADNVLKQFIADNEIRSIEKAAFLAGIASEDLQAQAITACIQGASLKKLKLMVEQSKSIKSIKHRLPTRSQGRQASSVSLGATKNIKVAKMILDSVLTNNSLSHIAGHFKGIDLNNYKTMSDTFKQLIKKLEELHA